MHGGAMLALRTRRITLRTLNSTPERDKFRMPAEYERHSGCWMLWPERCDNWRSGAKPAQASFATVATAIAMGEPVTVGVSAQQFQNARARLGEQPETATQSASIRAKHGRRSDMPRS